MSKPPFFARISVLQYDVFQKWFSSQILGSVCNPNTLIVFLAVTVLRRYKFRLILHNGRTRCWTVSIHALKLAWQSSDYPLLGIPAFDEWISNQTRLITRRNFEKKRKSLRNWDIPKYPFWKVSLVLASILAIPIILAYYYFRALASATGDCNRHSKSGPNQCATNLLNPWDILWQWN